MEVGVLAGEIYLELKYEAQKNGKVVRGTLAQWLSLYDKETLWPVIESALSNGREVEFDRVKDYFLRIYLVPSGARFKELIYKENGTAHVFRVKQ